MKHMPTPPDAPFVSLPGDVFQWLMTAFATVLAWIFRRHLKDDDDRAKATDHRLQLQEALIERRHAENVAGREAIRAEMSKGNENLMGQIIAMRREIVDVLLQMRSAQ